MFWSTGWSLWRAEGFSCSLGILYRGLGISKLQFLIKKIKLNSLSTCPASAATQGSCQGIPLQHCCGSMKFWFGSWSADPYIWLMDPDPDPANVIVLYHHSFTAVLRGSMNFWFGSRSADPYIWLMDPDPDPAKVCFIPFLYSSVADPWNFGADPDPRIHTFY
jgi:hypothetical protein